MTLTPPRPNERDQPALTRADAETDAGQELETEIDDGSRRAERIGLYAGPLLAAAAVVLTHPACGGYGGFSANASCVLALLGLMATWWVTLAVDPAITGLLPFVFLGVLGIGTTTEIAAPYANDVIFLFGGGALIALALERTAVSQRFAAALIAMAGTSSFRVLAALMIGSALLSAFVSNLATAATMMPLALALGLQARTNATNEAQRAAAGRFLTSLLLGVAFASSIGGALTIIGSPPNPIAVNWLRENGVDMTFNRWLYFSVPTTLVFLPIAITILGLWLFPARELSIAQLRITRPTIGRDGYCALAVFAAAVLAWVLQPFYSAQFPGVKDGTVAVAAATILFFIPSATRVGRKILDPSALTKIPWRVLMLFGGGLCLADAMKNTGLSTALGTMIAQAGTLPSVGLLIVLVTTLVFASEVASNTTLAAMAVPIVGALAPGLGVAPETLVIPAVFAASWAFAMPVGTPPNALIYASGHVRARDMMRAGVILDVVAIIVIVVMAKLLL